MKTKILYFLTMALIVMSCGRGSKLSESSESSELSESSESASKENSTNQKKDVFKIHPESTKLRGDLKDYFKIVDRSYKLSPEDISTHKIIVEFERTDKELEINEGYELVRSDIRATTDQKLCRVGFGIEILDEDGDIIYKRDCKDLFDGNEHVNLCRLKPGEIGTIQFGWIHLDNAKPVEFRINSLMYYDN